MLKFLIRLLLTGGLIALILHDSDMAAVGAAIVDFGLWPFLGAIAFFAAIPILSGISWRYVIRAMGYDADGRWAWLTCWTAMFFSQGLPSTMGGDAVRMIHGRQAGLPVAGSVGSVLIDRLAAFAALLLTAAVGWAGSLYTAGAFSTSALKWAHPILIGGCLVALIFAMSLDRLQGTVLPQRLRSWELVKKIGEVSATLRRVLLSPHWGPRIMVPAIATHAVRVGLVLLIAHNMGLEISLIDCLTVVPLALLVAMVPVTVAGWGLREGSFVAAFGVLGVPAADAFALSVLFGLVIVATSLPGGLIWLLGPKPEGTTARN